MMLRAIEGGIKEAGFDVSRQELQSFAIYAEELIKWNHKINLTAITEKQEVAVKHFVDSMYFAQHINGEERLLDIGSGAGIPAIPLKIVRPGTEVVSIDAVAKKILFQRHVARILGFKGFDALHVRAEEMAGAKARLFDVITSRAFSSLTMFVALAAPLLAKGGRIIAMKGPALINELEGASDLLTSLGLEIRSVTSYELPYNFGERRIITITHCNN